MNKTHNIVCFTQLGVEITRELLHLMGYRIPFKSSGYFVGMGSMVYRVDIHTKEVRIDEEISNYDLRSPNNYRAFKFINKYITNYSK